MAGVAQGRGRRVAPGAVGDCAVPTTRSVDRDGDRVAANPGPEMTGSAVVVSVLPLAGLAIVGAAGAVGRATVKVSVAAVELGRRKRLGSRRSCGWRCSGETSACSSRRCWTPAVPRPFRRWRR